MKKICQYVTMAAKGNDRMVFSELRRFGDLTSAKGVGRAIKAENGCLKFMWIFAVIFLLCVTIYNVCNLTIEFTAYNTGTKIIEKKIDIEQAGSDVLICNINPYSASKLDETFLKRKEYNELISDWMNLNILEKGQVKPEHLPPNIEQTGTDFQSNDRPEQISQMSRSELQPLNSIRQELLTGHSGFYQHLGPEGASNLSHQWRNFIIGCQVYFLDGVMEKSVPCSQTKLKLETYRHKNHFNCFKIFGEKKRGVRPSTGMSFLLYIDNDLVNNGINDMDMMIGGRGAMVAIGQSGAFLNPTTEGVYVLPNYINIIKFKPIVRNRLSKPYGNCKKIDGHSMRHVVNSSSNVPFLYTEESCLSACIEFRLIEACGCQDVGQHGILLDVFKNVSMCGSTNQGRDALFERMSCVMKWRNKFRKLCLALCPHPCLEKMFDKNVNYLEISASHLKNYLRKEKHQSSVLDMGSYEKQTREPSLDNLNTSNFVWVHLKRDRTNYFEVKDTVDMTITDWLAKVGGAMNLWSGITVFVFVEIVDFLCRLVNRVFSSEMNRDNDNDITPSHGSCECNCQCDMVTRQVYGNKNSSVNP